MTTAKPTKIVTITNTTTTMTTTVTPKLVTTTNTTTTTMTTTTMTMKIPPRTTDTIVTTMSMKITDRSLGFPEQRAVDRQSLYHRGSLASYARRQRQREKQISTQCPPHTADWLEARRFKREGDAKQGRDQKGKRQDRMVPR